MYTNMLGLGLECLEYIGAIAASLRSCPGRQMNAHCLLARQTQTLNEFPAGHGSNVALMYMWITVCTNSLQLLAAETDKCSAKTSASMLHYGAMQMYVIDQIYITAVEIVMHYDHTRTLHVTFDSNKV